MTAAGLPHKAHTVVVGAGIAGCSVAYHLQQRGVRDIVVVDKGPLFATGGSTSHAPGGILTMDARSPLITQFGRDSAALYEGMGAYSRTGSLDIARTEIEAARLEEKVAKCEEYGHRGMEVLSSSQTAELYPLVEAHQVHMSLYFPRNMRPSTPGRASAVEVPLRSPFTSRCC